MNGKERRELLLNYLRESKTPTSGVSLSQMLDVSRQVIVQDVALLRANGAAIISTNQGYLMQEKTPISRIFKIQHTDEETREELNLMVDLGGYVIDVFVYHKIYGLIRADMNIGSRLDIDRFIEGIETGKSSLLKNVTAGYHYHTVSAASKQLLDIIEERLRARGFLAQLQDYEPEVLAEQIRSLEA